MRYFTRNLTFRVLAGLLIGIGMFYFKQANAQTCPAGQGTIYTVTITGTTVSNCPVNCVVGQKLYSVAAVNACTTEGVVCSANSAHKWGGLRDSPIGNRKVVDAGGTEVNFGGVAVDASCGACPSGQTLLNGQCTTVECPAGQHSQGTQCLPDVCPVAGAADSILISGTPSSSYCVKQADGTNCQVNVTIGTTIGGSGSGGWTDRLYSGATCPTPTTETTSPVTPITTPVGTITPDATKAPTLGNKSCVSIDGSVICLGEPPADGKCRITPNGGSVCVTSTDPTKPSATPPDTGVPGRPAIPQATSTTTTTGSSQASATAGFYSPAQVNNSTNYRGSAPSTGTGTGTGTSTKIDESGTAATGNTLADPDLETGRAAAGGTGSGVAGVVMPGTSAFSSGSCQSISLEPPPNLANALGLDFGGISMQLPGALVCQQIDTLKNIAGWGMAFFVFWAATFALLRNSASPSGVRMATIND